MKIAHFISHPIQYHVPLYKLLYKEFGKDFVVVYARGPGRYYDDFFEQHVEWDVDTATNYEWEIVKTSKIGDFFLRYKPDVCWLHGYSSVRQLYTFLIAKRYGCKVWLRGESSLPLDYHPWQSPLRALFLPHFFEHIDAFLAIGCRNREFYQEHGVHDEKIVNVPYAVDRDFWKPAPVERDPNLIIFVGKLIPEKGLHRLKDWLPTGKQLVFVGDGPLRNECEQMGRVTGFVNQQEVRTWMQRASLLILPSVKEPYGIVILEAWACGCAVSGSKEVNALYDDPATQTFEADLEGIRKAMIL